jgi:gliding motility-associated-like protein
MKTMKTIIAILILNTYFTNCLNAQSDTGSVWVTFNNQLDVPVLSGGKFVSSKQEIQQLIEQFNIYNVTQALPDSKQDKLKSVYEVNCFCKWEELENEMDKLSFLDYPVKAPEYELLFNPNDYNTIFATDYALDLINAKTAWDYSIGDTNVIIGVSDGNFYTNHEELQDKVISNTAPAGGPTSYYTHGTAVAITAAGSTNNGIGKSSIGYNCKLSLTNMGYNQLLSLSYGGARVINASWTSGCSYSGYVQMVIDEVYNNGTIVVAAAGNASCGNPNNLVYPAACDHVIAVSSVGPSNNHERTIGNPTTTHQHNTSVDLCAPGYDVALSGNAGWYLTSSGTSFASPYVAGTIGLMLAIRPCLTYEEALYILQATAFNLDSLNPNYAGKLGAGRIDAGLALEFTKNLSLSISANISNVTCFGENNGAIDIVTNGGAGANSFFWSTANGSGIVLTQEDQSNLTPGSYNLLIEDAQGCSLDTTFNISSPSALNINSTVSAFASGTNISCFGVNDGNIGIQMTGGSGSYNYTWSTTNGFGLQAGQGSQSALSAGVYSLIVVDSNNCEASETFNLVGPSQLNVQFNVSNVTCFGENNGAIDIVTNGGAGISSFFWSTANGSGIVLTQEDQSNLTTGSYNLLIEDAQGCSFDTTFIISSPPALNINSTVTAFASGTNISCFGVSDGNIGVQMTGGSGTYNYEWSTTNGSGLQTGQSSQSALAAGGYSLIVTDSNHCEASETFNIVGPSQLNVQFNVSNVTCFGENNGTIDIVTNGGAGNNSFFWSTANGSGIVLTQEDQSNLTPGSYNLLIEDAQGCSFDTTFIISSPSALNINSTVAAFASGTNISCFGVNDGNIGIQMTGGSGTYNYAWSTTNGSGLQTGQSSQSALAAGVYSLIVTDSNNCEASETFDLVGPSQLNVQFNVSNTTCFGADNGTIDIVTNGGAGISSFFWSTANGSGIVLTQEDQSNLTPGSYNLLIEDAQGCSFDTTFIISTPPALNINSTVTAFASGTNISCFGVSDGNIGVQMTGGSGTYNYEWSTTNGSGLQTGQSSQSALAAGGYSLIVTDSNHCEASETFNLVGPSQLNVQFNVSEYASGDNIACFGSNNGWIEAEVDSNTVNCSFNWSTANGQGLVNTIQNQNNLTAGTYFLTVTDLYGCSIHDSIVLNAPEELTLDLTILSNYYGQQVSCEGSEDGIINVSASGGTPGYSFNWNNTQATTQEVFSSAKNGENTVVLQDLNGCEISSSIILTANPMPQLNPSPRIDACIGENVTINSNILENEYCVWQLSNGMTIFDNQSAVINLPNAGCVDASFMVTNEFGCKDSVFYENYICIHAIPVASFITNHTEINENDVNFTNNSDGATEFEWFFGDGASSTEMNPFHYYDAADPVQGNYEVTLFAYNDYGCYDSTSQEITIKDDLLIFVPNSFTPNGDEFNNTFKPVYGSSFTLVEYDLLIYNRWGEIVFQSMDISFGWDGTIKGQIAPEGVYIWKLNIKTDDRIIADSNSKQMTGNINLIR